MGNMGPFIWACEEFHGPLLQWGQEKACFQYGVWRWWGWGWDEVWLGGKRKEFSRGWGWEMNCGGGSVLGQECGYDVGFLKGGSSADASSIGLEDLPVFVGVLPEVDSLGVMMKKAPG